MPCADRMGGRGGRDAAVSKRRRPVMRQQEAADWKADPLGKH